MSSDNLGNTSRIFWIGGKNERKILKDSREKNNCIQKNKSQRLQVLVFSLYFLVGFLFLWARVNARKKKKKRKCPQIPRTHNFESRFYIKLKKSSKVMMKHMFSDICKDIVLDLINIVWVTALFLGFFSALKIMWRMKQARLQLDESHIWEVGVGKNQLEMEMNKRDHSISSSLLMKASIPKVLPQVMTVLSILIQSITNTREVKTSPTGKWFVCLSFSPFFPDSLMCFFFMFNFSGSVIKQHKISQSILPFCVPLGSCSRLFATVLSERILE